jgi:hypothetical protein
MLKQQKKEELKDRVGAKGTYREVFSDVGDLLLGFLGNPKATNFCQSFLHLPLSTHQHSPSSVLASHSPPLSLTLRKEEEEEQVSSTNLSLSLSLSIYHSLTTKKEKEKRRRY